MALLAEVAAVRRNDLAGVNAPTAPRPPLVVHKSIVDAGAI
jgi:hypothetical protein